MIGGRDQQQNELIVKRYLRQGRGTGSSLTVELLLYLLVVTFLSIYGHEFRQKIAI